MLLREINLGDYHSILVDDEIARDFRFYVDNLIMMAKVSGLRVEFVSKTFFKDKSISCHFVEGDREKFRVDFEYTEQLAGKVLKDVVIVTFPTKTHSYSSNMILTLKQAIDVI